MFQLSPMRILKFCMELWSYTTRFGHVDMWTGVVGAGHYPFANVFVMGLWHMHPIDGVKVVHLMGWRN